MRKLLPALLLCGTLLPGCVLAIGNGDDGDKTRHRLDDLERRVSALEQEYHHGDGPMDMSHMGDHEHHDGPESHEMHR